MRWQIDRPSPGPARPVEWLLVAVELVEDLPHVMLGNAGAGIPHLQFHFIAALAHRQHDAPLPRVAQRIGKKVLQHPAQQASVAAYPGGTREQIQAQPASGRNRCVLRGQLAHQRTDIEFADHRMQAAGIQPRHIQQAVQQLLGRAQRRIHAFGQIAVARRLHGRCRAAPKRTVVPHSTAAARHG